MSNLEKYRKRYHVKRHRRRNTVMPISRDPAKKRTFTARIRENGVTKYIGTFDSMTDCAQAHKAYLKTLIS